MVIYLVKESPYLNDAIQQCLSNISLHHKWKKALDITSNQPLTCDFHIKNKVVFPLGAFAQPFVVATTCSDKLSKQ